MEVQQTLLLSRKHVSDLLDIRECIDAVASAFRARAEGRVLPPKVLAMHVHGGGFHTKSAVMQLERNYFVVKTNGNFPANKRLHNLPTIQGVAMLCDAGNGSVLALIDSMELTLIRTGAATGAAARYLARKESSVVTICGCGNQGRISLMALRHTHEITKVFVYDTDHQVADTYARELSERLQMDIEPVRRLSTAVLRSDICVTCTPSKEPLLFKDDVREGTFIAAVGADSEDKNEIDPGLVASAKLFADVAEQSATFGDFHHALNSGSVDASHLYAELGDVIAGTKTGRVHDKEIILFDSTGTALQDVVAAALVYERAVEQGIGLQFNFGH